MLDLHSLRQSDNLRQSSGEDRAERVVPVLPEEVTRAKVHEFEAAILNLPAHLQVKLEVRHHFAPGIYMRELIIPAGVVTTGAIHKYPCLNILAKGKRATLIDGKIQIIEAPHIHLAPAGIKRVSYTIEDAVWVTVHNTDERDIEKLERDLVCNTEEEYLHFQKSLEHFE